MKYISLKYGKIYINSKLSYKIKEVGNIDRYDSNGESPPFLKNLPNYHFEYIKLRKGKIVFRTWDISKVVNHGFTVVIEFFNGEQFVIIANRKYIKEFWGFLMSELCQDRVSFINESE